MTGGLERIQGGGGGGGGGGGWGVEGAFKESEDPSAPYTNSNS